MGALQYRHWVATFERLEESLLRALHPPSLRILEPPRLVSS